MKTANEIPPGVGITDLSRILASRMTADKSVRAIAARSIENGLRIWRFWPVT